MPIYPLSVVHENELNLLHISSRRNYEIGLVREITDFTFKNSFSELVTWLAHMFTMFVVIINVNGRKLLLEIFRIDFKI